MTQPALRIDDVSKQYEAPASRGERAVIRACRHVDISIEPGEILALVGESGSGKSTVGRLVLRLIEPDEGSINLLGTDIAKLSRGELRRMRSHATMIFQDPYTSLDPRMLIKDSVAEPLIVHTDDSRATRQKKALEMVRRVGLDAAHLERFPYEMSGGQLQRVAIARALITDPSFIVCDEPVAALDVSTQAQVINLLDDLQQERGISYLFISHDLRLVRLIADEVAVMRRGQLVETGPAERVFVEPEHDYTRELLAAIPGRTPRDRRFDVEVARRAGRTGDAGLAEPDADAASLVS